LSSRGCRLFVVLIVAGAIASCGDECEVGEVRCFGNTMATCKQTVPRQWHMSDCGAHLCREVKTPDMSMAAVCALEGKPNAACLPNLERACTVDERAVSCQHGYVVQVHQACLAPTACYWGSRYDPKTIKPKTIKAHEAKCLVRHPACLNPPLTIFCLEGIATACSSGFALPFSGPVGCSVDCATAPDGTPVFCSSQLSPKR